MPRPRKHIHRDGFLTVFDLMERWGVSNTAVRNLVRAGTLKAHKFESGPKAPAYIALTEVELVERTGLRPVPRGRYNGIGTRNDPAWRTSEAFRMFRDGKTLADVVIALRMTIGQVDELYKEYQNGNMADRYRSKKTVI